MNHFRHFVAIDWSGAKGKRQNGVAVAIADADGGPPVLVRRPWSRNDVLDVLLHALPPNTLVGLDLGIALPFADCGAYFPHWLDSPSDARTLWALIDATCDKEENLGATAFVDHPEVMHYYRNGTQTGRHFGCDGASHGRGRFRVTEAAQSDLGCRPYSNFNLVGAAQVGKSSLTGMRMLHKLSGTLPVWPIDCQGPPSRGSLVVEIYTTIAAVAAGRKPGQAKMRSFDALNEALGVLGSPTVEGSGPIDDHSSDALLTAAWMRVASTRPELWAPPRLTHEVARTEGWTFGAQ